MKERINELAAQTLVELHNQGWNMGTDPFNKFTDKFAELIVRECLMKATGAMIRKESIKELIVNIAEDFGVEI